ncbi:hypothetical protein HY212_01910 [Candidatus Pacearchaeota archaeon]|nr:hypothetical protein [Candidatus Pacearchaeota archaeon]
MVLKFKLNNTSRILILASMLQIILLVNSSFAYSYIISEGDNNNGNSVIDIKGFENILAKGMRFFVSFLSIKQIGIVSAANVCCEKKNNGELCAEADSSECDTSDSSLSVSPEACKDTPFCITGSCYDPNSGFCSENSPKAKCISEHGEWTQDYNDKCRPGCCELGVNRNYVSEKACENLGNALGITPVFSLDKTEQQCRYYTQDEGACILEDNKCKFTTESNCLDTGGIGGLDFKKNIFCSDPNLGLNITSHASKGCVEGKEDVYYFDNSPYKNPEDVAQDCKIREETCDDSSGTAVCKNLNCVDKNNKTRVNGESWCEYDSYVGDGKDLPGSSHWLLSCADGNIQKPIECGGDKRTQVCEEKIVDGISQAQCRVNLGALCFRIDNQAECEGPTGTPDCMWFNLSVDEQFKFDVCLPKYNEGFTDQSQAEKVCGIATQTCTIVEQKGWDLSWSCKVNCNCEGKEFPKQMNNFCTSLGDCGAKPNYAGNGRDNYLVQGETYLTLEPLCIANNVCGTECLQEKAARRGGGWDSEEIKDPISGAGTGDYMNCKGENPLMKAPLWRRLIKKICNDNGQCVAGQYVIDKPRSSDFMSYLNKTNEVGVNTPEYISDPNDAGTYGDQFNPQGDTQTDYRNINGFFEILFSNWGAHVLLIPFMVFAPITFFLKSIFGIGKTRTKDVTFTCQPWKPPIGGVDCGKCNADPSKPCTQYRCESLGTACALVKDSYDNENPLCYNAYANETTPPVISPDKIKSGLKFIPGNNSVSIKTADDQCIRNDQMLSFSLKTDEYAECKWSQYPLPLFDNMPELFKEGNAWGQTHTIEDLHLPPHSGGSSYRMYVRCIDHPGNWNRNEYIVDICINPAPDKTPPIITRTEPANGSYLIKGITESSLKIVLSEAAECRYSNIQNTKYENMSENMACNNEAGENGTQVYEWNCRTQLQNLTQEKNSIYIKCNDSAGNFNNYDTEYVLYQTKEDLRIVSTSPENGSVIDPISQNSPFYLEATTAGGMNNGIATCGYKFIKEGWRDQFTETNAVNHRYKFTSIPEGSYDVEIKCHDVAGNEAKEIVHFNINIDKYPPKVINITNEANGNQVNTKLTTDEPAQCYYNNEKCERDSENQTSITLGLDTEHWIYSLDPKQDYYVTCQDEWKNRNEKCAIVINATEKNDGHAPNFVRVYNDFGTLKLITDENAKCSYTGNSCNFNVSAGEGTFMTAVGGEYSKEHETEWNQQSTYHIQCEDSWHNANQGCLIVVKPFEVFARS